MRHGEAEGNVDERRFELKPDHQMVLTEKGVAQAKAAGQKIRDILQGDTIRVYVSPYVRARQTLAHLGIAEHIDHVREEPRLREQDWGNYQNSTILAQKEERNMFGHFFYRLADGESGADVYDRVSTFFESLFRDFLDDDFPDNAILITHGLTMRLFFMRWFHWTVEYFESLENPACCETKILTLQDRRYTLDRPFSQWKPASQLFSG